MDVIFPDGSLLPTDQEIPRWKSPMGCEHGCFGQVQQFSTQNTLVWAQFSLAHFTDIKEDENREPGQEIPGQKSTMNLSVAVSAGAVGHHMGNHTDPGTLSPGDWNT